MDMSFCVYCAILCLLIGRHPVAPSRKGPTVIQGPMPDVLGNTVDSVEYRFTSEVKIAAGAIVHEGSILRGDITIGAGTVVSPQARIIADSGSIVIGGGNIIEAMASIINRNYWAYEHSPGIVYFRTRETEFFNKYAVDTRAEGAECQSHELKNSASRARVRPGGPNAGETQRIGNGNIFKGGSICEALRVGGGNIFLPGAHVGREVVVTNGNIIGPS